MPYDKNGLWYPAGGWGGGNNSSSTNFESEGDRRKRERFDHTRQEAKANPYKGRDVSGLLDGPKRPDPHSYKPTTDVKQSTPTTAVVPDPHSYKPTLPDYVAKNDLQSRLNSQKREDKKPTGGKFGGIIGQTSDKKIGNLDGLKGFFHDLGEAAKTGFVPSKELKDAFKHDISHPGTLIGRGQSQVTKPAKDILEETFMEPPIKTLDTFMHDSKFAQDAQDKRRADRAPVAQAMSEGLNMFGETAYTWAAGEVLAPFRAIQGLKWLNSTKSIGGAGIKAALPKLGLTDKAIADSVLGGAAKGLGEQALTSAGNTGLTAAAEQAGEGFFQRGKESTNPVVDAGKGLRRFGGNQWKTAGYGAKMLGFENLGNNWVQEGEAQNKGYESTHQMTGGWSDMLDPYYWSGVFGENAPTSLAFIPLGIAGRAIGAGGASLMKMGKFGTAVMEGLGAASLTAPLESAMEAAGTYEQMFKEGINKGLSKAEAHKAAQDAGEKTWWRNMALLGVTNAYEFRTLFGAGNKVTSNAKKMFQGATMEGGQEMAQQAIQDSSMGKPIDLLSPDYLTQGLFGAAMGVGVGSISSGHEEADNMIQSIKTRVFLDMNDELKVEVAENRADAAAQGIPQQQADEVMLERIAEQEPQRVHAATEEVKQNAITKQELQTKPDPQEQGQISAGPVHDIKSGEKVRIAGVTGLYKMVDDRNTSTGYGNKRKVQFPDGSINDVPTAKLQKFDGFQVGDFVEVADRAGTFKVVEMRGNKVRIADPSGQTLHYKADRLLAASHAPAEYHAEAPIDGQEQVNLGDDPHFVERLSNLVTQLNGQKNPESLTMTDLPAGVRKQMQDRAYGKLPEDSSFELRKVKLTDLEQAQNIPLKLDDVDRNMGGYTRSAGKPIMLDGDMSVLDGMHRIVNAIALGEDTIDAYVRVPSGAVAAPQQAAKTNTRVSTVEAPAARQTATEQQPQKLETYSPGDVLKAKSTQDREWHVVKDDGSNRVHVKDRKGHHRVLLKKDISVKLPSRGNLDVAHDKGKTGYTMQRKGVGGLKAGDVVTLPEGRSNGSKQWVVYSVNDDGTYNLDNNVASMFGGHFALSNIPYSDIQEVVSRAPEMAVGDELTFVDPFDNKKKKATAPISGFIVNAPKVVVEWKRGNKVIHHALYLSEILDINKAVPKPDNVADMSTQQVIDFYQDQLENNNSLDDSQRKKIDVLLAELHEQLWSDPEAVDNNDGEITKEVAEGRLQDYRDPDNLQDEEWLNSLSLETLRLVAKVNGFKRSGKKAVVIANIMELSRNLEAIDAMTREELEGKTVDELKKLLRSIDERTTPDLKRVHVNKLVTAKKWLHEIGDWEARQWMFDLGLIERPKPLLPILQPGDRVAHYDRVTKEDLETGELVAMNGDMATVKWDDGTTGEISGYDLTKRITDEQKAKSRSKGEEFAAQTKFMSDRNRDNWNPTHTYNGLPVEIMEFPVLGEIGYRYKELQSDLKSNKWGGTIKKDDAAEMAKLQPIQEQEQSAPAEQQQDGPVAIPDIGNSPDSINAQEPLMRRVIIDEMLKTATGKEIQRLMEAGKIKEAFKLFKPALKKLSFTGPGYTFAKGSFTFPSRSHSRHVSSYFGDWLQLVQVGPSLPLSEAKEIRPGEKVVMAYVSKWGSEGDGNAEQYVKKEAIARRSDSSVDRLHFYFLDGGHTYGGMDDVLARPEKDKEIPRASREYDLETLKDFAVLNGREQGNRSSVKEVLSELESLILQGNKKEAIKVYKKALGIHPQNNYVPNVLLPGEVGVFKPDNKTIEILFWDGKKETMTYPEAIDRLERIFDEQREQQVQEQQQPQKEEEEKQRLRRVYVNAAKEHDTFDSFRNFYSDLPIPSHVVGSQSRDSFLRDVYAEAHGEKQEQPTPQEESDPNFATVKTESGREIKVRYQIWDAFDNLTPSHNYDSLTPKVKYPKELQPRDRSRAASEEQVNRIANKLDPELLGANPKASDGAPIVALDRGIVESGNGRVLGIQRAYRINGEPIKKYQEWLQKNLKQFGLAPRDIEGVKHPILVRIRETKLTDEERIAFVQEANVSTVAAMSPVEQATVDAKKLTSGILSLYNGDLLVSQVSNREFVRQFMHTVVPANERGRYMLSDGSISQDGVRRITNAIFARVYGATAALERMSESTDNNVRNITHGMLQAAGRILKLKEAVENGDAFQLDITDDISAAVNKLSELRDNEETVEYYLNQGDLFGEALSQEAKNILVLFDTYKRNAKKIRDALIAYAQIALDSGSPNQSSLFEAAPPTKSGTLFAAISKVGEGEPDAQLSLFGQGQGNGQEAVSPSSLEGEAAGAQSQESRTGSQEKTRPQLEKLTEKDLKWEGESLRIPTWGGKSKLIERIIKAYRARRAMGNKTAEQLKELTIPELEKIMLDADMKPTEDRQPRNKDNHIRRLLEWRDGRQATQQQLDGNGKPKRSVEDLEQQVRHWTDRLFKGVWGNHAEAVDSKAQLLAEMLPKLAAAEQERREQAGEMPSKFEATNIYQDKPVMVIERRNDLIYYQRENGTIGVLPVEMEDSLKPLQQEKPNAEQGPPANKGDYIAYRGGVAQVKTVRPAKRELVVEQLRGDQVSTIVIPFDQMEPLDSLVTDRMKEGIRDYIQKDMEQDKHLLRVVQKPGDSSLYIVYNTDDGKMGTFSLYGSGKVGDPSKPQKPSRAPKGPNWKATGRNDKGGSGFDESEYVTVWNISDEVKGNRGSLPQPAPQPQPAPTEEVDPANHEHWEHILRQLVDVEEMRGDALNQALEQNHKLTGVNRNIALSQLERQGLIKDTQKVVRTGARTSTSYGFYSITDKGRAYLNGEVSPAPAPTQQQQESFLDRMKRWENDARKYIEDNKDRTNSLPIDMFARYAVIGASKIAHGTADFTAWSKEMMDEFGDWIRLHLPGMYAQAQAITQFSEADLREYLGEPAPTEQPKPEPPKQGKPTMEEVEARFPIGDKIEYETAGRGFFSGTIQDYNEDRGISLVLDDRQIPVSNWEQFKLAEKWHRPADQAAAENVYGKYNTEDQTADEWIRIRDGIKDGDRVTVRVPEAFFPGKNGDVSKWQTVTGKAIWVNQHPNLGGRQVNLMADKEYKTPWGAAFSMTLTEYGYRLNKIVEVAPPSGQTEQTQQPPKQEQQPPKQEQKPQDKPKQEQQPEPPKQEPSAEPKRSETRDIITQQPKMEVQPRSDSERFQVQLDEQLETIHKDELPRNIPDSVYDYVDKIKDENHRRFGRDVTRQVMNDAKGNITTTPPIGSGVSSNTAERIAQHIIRLINQAQEVEQPNDTVVQPSNTAERSPRNRPNREGSSVRGGESGRTDSGRSGSSGGSSRTESGDPGRSDGRRNDDSGDNAGDSRLGNDVVGDERPADVVEVGQGVVPDSIQTDAEQPGSNDNGATAGDEGLQSGERVGVDVPNFVEYVPQRITGQGHPGDVVEPFGLSLVSYPEEAFTDPKYKVHPKVTKGGEEKLSDIQLEAVQLAKYNFENGKKGMLIADDTGLGKTAEQVAIAADAIHSGKVKRVLIVTKNDQVVDGFLNENQKFDFGLEMTMVNSQSHSSFKDDHRLELPWTQAKIDKMKPDKRKAFQDKIAKNPYKPLNVPDGVMVMSQYTFRDSSYAVNEWLRGAGGDVIVMFDESHIMKNISGEDAALVAKVAKELYENFQENGQFIYSSATAAEDIAGMEHLYGLKLWGPDTFHQFRAALQGQSSLALSGSSPFEREIPLVMMEQIVRELKLSGQYVGRALSMDGIAMEGLEVVLTKDELAEWKRASEFIQLVAEEGEKTKTRGQQTAFFVGYMRRLRGYYVMKGVIRWMQQNSKNGVPPRAALAGFFKSGEDEETGENAMLEAAITKVKNIDVRTGLLAALHDQSGSRPVPHLPSPVEMLEQAFGSGSVAVISGDVSTSGRMAAVQEFQSGKKRIVYFTQSGNTGINLHDTIGEQITFIPVDYPWEAKEQKQSEGRVNRTGQKTKPRFIYPATQSAVDKKFVGTLKARYEAMGALSRGKSVDLGGETFGDFDFSGVEAQYAVFHVLPLLTAEERGAMFGSKAANMFTTKEDDGNTLPNDPLSVQQGVRELLKKDPTKKFLNSLMLLDVQTGTDVFNKFVSSYQIVKQAMAVDGGVAGTFETYYGAQQAITQGKDGIKVRRIKTNLTDEQRDVIQSNLKKAKKRLADAEREKNLARTTAAQKLENQITRDTARQTELRAEYTKAKQQVKEIQKYNHGQTQKEVDRRNKKYKTVGEQLGRVNDRIKLNELLIEKVRAGGQKAEDAYKEIPFVKKADADHDYAIYNLMDAEATAEANDEIMLLDGLIVTSGKMVKIRNAIQNAAKVRYQGQTHRIPANAMRVEVRGYILSGGTRVVGVVVPAWAEQQVAEALEAKVQPQAPGSRTQAETAAGSAQQRAFAAPAIAPATQVTPQVAVASNVVKRSKIYKHIYKHFKIPMGVGRYRKKALGIYTDHIKEIRTKSYGDFVVLAHELGHALDERYDFSKQRQFASELLTLGNSLQIPKGYTQDQIISEGVAEFLRRYLYDPANAQLDAPAFYQHFEDTLINDGKFVAMSELYDMLQAWHLQSARQHMQSITDQGKPKKMSFIDRMREINIGLYEELAGMDIAFKKFYGKRKLMPKGNKSVYHTAWRARGVAGKIKAFLHYGVTDNEGNKIGKSLEEILSKQNVPDLSLFRDYLMALRGKELIEDQGRSKTPMEKKHYDTIIYQAENGPNGQKYLDARDALYQYQNEITNVLVEGNFLSPTQVSQWRKEHLFYVPFYRVMEESGTREDSMNSGNNQVGNKMGNLNNPVHSMKDDGSARNIIDPLESIIKNTYLFLSLAARNEAGTVLLENIRSTPGSAQLAVEVPNGVKGTTFNLFEIAKELKAAGFDTSDPNVDLEKYATVFKQTFYPDPTNRILNVWEMGKIVQVQIRDEMMYRSFLALDIVPLPKWVKVLGAPNQWLKAGITLVPSFIPKNAMRGAPTFMIQSDAFTSAKDYLDLIPMFFKALGSTIMRGEAYQKWEASGAAHSTMMSISETYLSESTDSLLRGTYKEKMKREGLKGGMGLVMKSMRYLSELGDAPFRIIESQKTLEKTGDATLAAVRSRDVDLDFNKFGSQTRIPNGLNMFFNIAVQGPNRVYRSFRDHPVRTPIRGAAFLTLPAMLLYMLNRDDPEYWRLPQWERDLFFIIPTGLDGPLHFLKIPIPFEWGLIFKTIPERIMGAQLDEQPGFANLGKTAAGILIPSMIPTFIEPIIEWAFGGSMLNLLETTPTIPARLQNKAPEQQFTPNTSEVAKKMGEWTQSSPLKIEKFITGYTGTMGKMGLDMMDWGMKETGIANPPPKPEGSGYFGDRGMLAKAFFTGPEVKGSQTMEDFYIKLKKQENDYDRSGITGNPPKPLSNLRKVSAELNALRKMKDTILLNTKSTPKAKRDTIDSLEKAMNDIAAKAIGQKPLHMANMLKAQHQAETFKKRSEDNPKRAEFYVQTITRELKK